MFYNFIIRYFLESYFEIAIASFINIVEVRSYFIGKCVQRRWDNPTYQFSTIFAMIMGGLSIGFPIIIGVFLLAFKAKLPSPNFKAKFESFYENIDISRKTALLYNVLFILRRLINAAVVIFLMDYPGIQVQILIMISLLLLIYLMFIMPMETKRLNYLEIFNELCVLFSCLHLFIFTDYVKAGKETD